MQYHRVLMVVLKGLGITLLFLCVLLGSFTVEAYAEPIEDCQSTTGPEPPPGVKDKSEMDLPRMTKAANIIAGKPNPQEIINKHERYR